jgi:phage portal protein BeeE
VPREFLPALRRAFGRGIETKGLAGRVMSEPRSWTTPGQPYQSDWNVDRAVREGYQYNPYIFRCVEVICANAIERTMALREGDPKKGRILKPEEMTPAQRRLLWVMNRKSNPTEVAKIFRHRLVANYVLSSKGVFVEAVRNNAGGIHSLHLLDGDRVDIVAGSNTPIGSFRILKGAEDGGYDYLPPWDPDADVTDQPSGVAWIRSPHPTLFSRGMSPMEAAGLSADLDKYARLYNRTFLQNDGRPGGVLSVKGPLSESTELRLQSRFQGGPSHAGRTTVIEADEMSWVDTSGTPRDTQWGDTMSRTEKEFSIAFGVPESMMGDASGRTFDNADAEVFNWWEHSEGPLLSMLDAQLDQLTPGGFDDDIYLQHDTSDVWVLGRNQRTDVDRAVAHMQAGLLSIDDVLEVMGRDRIDVPATRTLWVPGGKVIVNDADPEHAGDAEAVAKLPAVSGASAPPALGPGGGAALGAQLSNIYSNMDSAVGMREQAGYNELALSSAEAKELPPGSEGEQRGARASAWR